MLNKAVTKKHRLSLTKMRANYIRKNLEGYVARYGFLPYASSNLNGLESEGVCVGYLPYRTLGIDKSYAYDGSGKPFSFMVNKNLVLKFQKNLGYIIRPPFLHESLYAAGARSWGRLFVYKTSANHSIIHPSKEHELQIYLYDYDGIDEFFNIQILKDNVPIVLSKIYAYPVVNKNTLPTHLAVHFQDFKGYRFYYPIYDVIAWVLISGSEKSHEIRSSPCVFWQSRFHLASQINCAITSSFTYIGSEQVQFWKSCIKYKKHSL